MTKQPSVPPENVKDEPSIGADNVKGPRVWQAFWSGLALSFAWIKGPDREQDDEYLDLVEKSYADKLEAELREAKAEVERLKAQDLTHAVIASDIKLREERDALAAKLKVARGALEFSLEGLAMWRKFQSPGNIAEVEERIRQALAEIGEGE